LARRPSGRAAEELQAATGILSRTIHRLLLDAGEEPLDERALIVRDQRGTDRFVPLEYAGGHLDYGYALTGHAARGATVDRAYVLLSDRGALQEWGYVVCSRARLETGLYLSDRDMLERETPLREPDPASAPERAARTLQRSAVEPLALDQSRERSDTTIRLIAQQRERLDRQREHTAKRLAAAQRELQRPTGGTTAAEAHSKPTSPSIGQHSSAPTNSANSCVKSRRGDDRCSRSPAGATNSRPRRAPSLYVRTSNANRLEL
jgi:hypothetical protein